MLVGHQPDPQPPDDWAEMVATGAPHRDRADDHQFVEQFGIGEFGDRRRLHVAAAKNLGQIHFGHASRRVLGVVIAFGVDHEAFQHALEFALYLVEQRLQFARLQKGRNIVVRVEPLIGFHEPPSDSRGDRLIGCWCVRAFHLISIPFRPASRL